MKTSTLSIGTQLNSRRWIGKTLTGLMLALLFSLGLAQPARAATITVSSTDDSGAGTLREALASAADGDTIDATGVSGTILLTNGQLLVSNSVTIVGAGPATLTVDGDTASRVFRVANAVTATISSLTISNGLAALNFGGGIYNDHSILTVSNCVVSGNFSTLDGGGIYNDGSSSGSAKLILIASTLSGNEAGNGGGIYNSGALSGSAVLTVSTCIISDNLAVFNGGGIVNDGNSGSATLTVSDCVLSDNSAGDSGGGIFSDSFAGSATLTVASSTLTGNSALSVGGGTGTGINGGGGICNDATGGSATLTVANSTLSDNSGEFGGGILTDGSLSGTATLTVSNSTLSSNMADVGGGGILNFNNTNSGSATLTVVASTLSGNSADIRGGGINNADGAATVANSTLSGNSAPFAGGIENSGGTLTVANCTFSGNSADDGGGIVNLAGGALEIGSTILKAGSPGANITNFISGTVTSHGFNLSSDDGSGFLTGTGDQINTDPLLGPLADNGGPTHTHLLLAGSPAIDGGTSDTLVPFGITTDQRGLARTVDNLNIGNAFLGDGTDIGAVEIEIPNNAPVAQCKNVTVLADAGGTANASIDDGSSDPDSGDPITLVQDPPGPYPIGTTTVTLTVTDGDGASDDCTADVTVVGVADLAISKAVVSGQAKPGQILIYTIVVTNTGPNPATAVAVNDPVPQGTTFSSASPTPSSAPAVGAAGTVVWSLGSLSSGASVTLTLKVKVSVKGNALVVNTATVTSSSSDPNLANNTATITSKRNTK